MIWKKTIYDSLTNCSTLCNEFATECLNSNRVEDFYKSIFLNLDCADMCRALANVYVRGSGNARPLAKSCIELCEKCAQEVQQYDSERSWQVYAICQQTIRSCTNIIEMGSQPETDSKKSVVSSRSSFYDMERQPSSLR
jgi:hypothetical protein